MLTLAEGNPIGHIINHKTFEVGGWWVWSSTQTMLVLAGALVILIGLFVAKKVQTGPESEGSARYLTKNPIASMFEVICVYLRENVVRPLLHERTERFMPFLWTLFFFILASNLLGLVPLIDLNILYQIFTGGDKHVAIIGGTATQSLYVTAVLAAISAIVINLAGIKELGLGGYVKHLTGGAPPMLWPIMVPIEIMGIFIKPVALAIRLFANMTAGHTLVATLLMFAGAGWVMLTSKGAVIGAPIAVVSTLGAIAIYFLEIFVAFLQAFVFMFLTTVFISLLAHHDEHGHAEGAHA